MISLSFVVWSIAAFDVIGIVGADVVGEAPSLGGCGSWFGFRVMEAPISIDGAVGVVVAPSVVGVGVVAVGDMSVVSGAYGGVVLLLLLGVRFSDTAGVVVVPPVIWGGVFRAGIGLLT